MLQACMGTTNDNAHGHCSVVVEKSELDQLGVRFNNLLRNISKNNNSVTQLILNNSFVYNGIINRNCTFLASRWHCAVSCLQFKFKPYVPKVVEELIELRDNTIVLPGFTVGETDFMIESLCNNKF